MPCYQSNTLPAGVTTAGRTGYRTEAECNQACKEGACCEGTVCTVKPQCQCQGAGKTFIGVGTVCTPNPCLCCNANGTPKSGSNCQQCWCFCGEGAAAYPRFINVSLSGTYKMVRPIFTTVQDGVQETGKEFRDKSFSCSITLSTISTASRENCPGWMYGTNVTLLPFGSGGAEGYVLIESPTYSSPTLAQFDVYIWMRDFSEGTSYGDWKTESWYIALSQEPIMSAGIQTSGTCFSDIATSFTAFTDRYFSFLGSDVRVNTISGSIAGVQA